MKAHEFWYRLLVLFVAIALTLWAVPCFAGDPGVFPDKIIVGSPADQSGPTAFATRAGIPALKAYFAKAFDEKIYPRKIEIVQEDGAYNPAMHIKAAKLLIDKHKVFCFILSSGTAPTLAINPILEQEKIPIIGQYTHAESIAVPPKKYMFQMHTTYKDQVKIAVDYIVEKEGKDVKIGIYYQDDGMGYDGLEGLREQMKKYGIKPVAEVSYKRGVIDVSSHALKLKAANTDYVIDVSLWVDAAKLLKEAKKLGWKPQFFGIGPAMDENIFKMAGDAMYYGKPFMGVAIQHPWWGDSWGAKEYRATLNKYYPDAPKGTFSQWSYGYGKILVEGLRRVEGELTREKVVKAVESFKGFDTGVFPPLTWGPNVRKGARSAQIWTTKGTSFVPITGWRDVK